LDCPRDTTLYQSQACPQHLYWKEPVVAGTCNIVDRQTSHTVGAFLDIGEHLLTYRYVDRDSAVHECRFAISVLQLPDTLYQHCFVCPGLGLSVNDTIVYPPATYCFDTCDYILCIDVVENHNMHDTTHWFVCSDEPYEFRDSVLSVPGDYTFLTGIYNYCYYMVIHYNTDCVSSTTHITIPDMRVYPNPSDGFVHVEIPLLQSTAHYDIWSVDGTCVQTGIVILPHFEIRIETPGLYMLRVRTEDGIMVKKLYMR
jgi:hypothetical protein